MCEMDLNWAPVLEAWVRKRSDTELQTLLRTFIEKWMDSSTPTDPGLCFDSLQRIQLHPTLPGPYLRQRVSTALEKSVGALQEAGDRMKFDSWLRKPDSNKTIMPKVDEGETI